MTCGLILTLLIRAWSRKEQGGRHGIECGWRADSLHCPWAYSPGDWFPRISKFKRRSRVTYCRRPRPRPAVGWKVFRSSTDFEAEGSCSRRWDIARSRQSPPRGRILWVFHRSKVSSTGSFHSRVFRTVGRRGGRPVVPWWRQKREAERENERKLVKERMKGN